MAHLKPQLHLFGALQGLTPLHHAAIGGSVQHVQALLAHGADVNAQATIELVNMDSITYPVSNCFAGLASYLNVAELHVLQR